MLKRFSSIIALALALAGCGGKTTAPQPTPTTAPAASGTMALGELAFYVGTVAGLRMHADGRIEHLLRDGQDPPNESWVASGKLAADGTITVAEGGAPIRIQPDGTVIGQDGQVAPVKLEGDALIFQDKRITIDVSGAVQGAPLPQPMRVEGATTPELRRTALAVLSLVIPMLAAAAEPPPDGE